MAAPTLFGQGTAAAVTSGNVTPVLPSHAADDILICHAVFWGPNSISPGFPGTPSGGWNVIQLRATGATDGLTAGGFSALYWLRATSGAMTNPTPTRGTNWDTGTDTCFGARCYVIRGCITSGNPFDHEADQAHTNAANATFPAITVSGIERMVVQFLSSMDNQAAGAAPSGWTAGTAGTDGTGTDCGFQTFRKDNVSSSTGADTSAVAAPAQGYYTFEGISFKPPDPPAFPPKPVVVNMAVPRSYNW